MVSSDAPMAKLRYLVPSSRGAYQVAVCFA